MQKLRLLKKEAKCHASKNKMAANLFSALCLNETFIGENVNIEVF